jgi:hypothetical protein
VRRYSLRLSCWHGSAPTSLSTSSPQRRWHQLGRDLKVNFRGKPRQSSLSPSFSSARSPPPRHCSSRLSIYLFISLSPSFRERAVCKACVGTPSRPRLLFRHVARIVDIPSSQTQGHEERARGEIVTRHAWTDRPSARWVTDATSSDAGTCACACVLRTRP